MAELLTTFPRTSEFAKAKAIADSPGLVCRVVSPEPGCARVGVPAMVLDDRQRAALMGHGGDGVVCSGLGISQDVAVGRGGLTRTRPLTGGIQNER